MKKLVVVLLVVFALVPLAAQEEMDAEFYYNRGIEYYNNGNIDLAIQDFSEAIRIKPDYVEAWTYRGAALNGTREWDKAIKDAREAIRINSDYTKAWNVPGAAFNYKKDYDLAIEYCIEAIRVNHNNSEDYSESYNSIGYAYLTGKGDLDHAIENYTKAIEYNPNSISAFS